MQLTTLQFPFPLHPGDIPKFRAAIVAAVGIGHHLFHGHDNATAGETKYSNAYPLIEFGVQRGQATITGIGPGAGAIVRHLLPVLPADLLIGERYVPADTYQLNTTTWEPELLPQQYTFGLYRWIALNKKNFASWKALEGNEPARAELLGACLTGHLRALAETVAPQLDRKQVEARILSVDKVKMISWHNTRLVAFNVVACANFIPSFGLGLGRCHSFGFGEVCGQERYQHLTRPSRRKEASVVI